MGPRITIERLWCVAESMIFARNALPFGARCPHRERCHATLFAAPSRFPSPRMAVDCASRFNRRPIFVSLDSGDLAYCTGVSPVTIPLVAVIDDDEALCWSLVDLIRSSGYRAEPFMSAETFLVSPGIRRSMRARTRAVGRLCTAFPISTICCTSCGGCHLQLVRHRVHDILSIDHSMRMRAADRRLAKLLTEGHRGNEACRTRESWPVPRV